MYFRLALRAPVRSLLAAFLLTICSAASDSAIAQQEVLVVRGIRVEGLQRIAEGTVFNYLPVNIGDRVDQSRIQEAIRAVYGTGFFRDVEIRWDKDTLVVVVAERPSIADFTITGNKDIRPRTCRNRWRALV